MSSEARRGGGGPERGTVVPRRLLVALAALCVLLLVGGELLLRLHHDEAHAHGGVGFDSWPGFHALAGFAACVLLVALARGARRLLTRPEDYYGD